MKISAAVPGWLASAGFQCDVAKGSGRSYLVSSEEARPIAAAAEHFSIRQKVELLL